MLTLTLTLTTDPTPNPSQVRLYPLSSSPIARCAASLVRARATPTPTPNPSPNPNPNPNSNPNPNPNPHQVRCVSPAASSSAEVVLLVSLNAVDYLGSANTTFIFSPSAAPLAAPHPGLGPTGGGTVLLLRLAPRPASQMAVAAPLLRCRFGLDAAAAILPFFGDPPPFGSAAAAAQAPASFEPDGRVRCVSPHTLAAPDAVPGAVSLSVALNGLQFEGGVPFLLFAPPTLQALHPAVGP